MSDFVMPSLGADMERGTILQWMVKPGDRVKRGDIVVEIETEKADMEVEIFEDGVVDELLVAVGEEVDVGTPLARVTPAAGTVPAPHIAATASAARLETNLDVSQPASPAAQPVAARRETPAPPPPPSVPAPSRATPGAHLLAEHLGIELANVRGTGKHGTITREDVERANAGERSPSRPTEPAATRRRVTPYARRLAAEQGIDLSAVLGSGPGGAIASRDLTTPGTPPAPKPEAPSPGKPEKPRSVARQRAIASLMARAKREIPHYYLQLPIDVTATIEWLQRENAKRPLAQRVLLPAVLLRAVALAATEHGEMNGFFNDEEFHPSSDVHLGVAIALRDGSLVAPAILDAGRKSLDELMAALRDMVERARANKLRASEMSGGTITVTNLGDSGVEAVHGVIFPPQVALVGFGKPLERPWAESGMLGVRTVVMATLAGDHRVSNGHRGGLFLSAIAHHLKKPEEL